MSDAPQRILIIDDDLSTRLLAGEALAAHGFETLEASDGLEALFQYERSAPDALLLDVNMPELDGHDVCRRLRAVPGGEAVPIMVMTANDDVDSVERAFAAGATDFITKPLNLSLLAHRMQYMLRASAVASVAREAVGRVARAQRLARLVHWQLAPDGEFTWATDPFEVLWPDAPADRGAFAEPLLDLVHPDDRARVARVLIDRSPHQLEFRVRLPDGTERYVHQDAAIEVTELGRVLIGATQDVTEQRIAAQQVTQLAFYDDVTGLPNRQFVQRLLRASSSTAPQFAIAIELGLEGAVASDELVRLAAARVCEVMRGDDDELRLDQAARRPEACTARTIVARTAVDELVVIAPGEAGESARRLAAALAQPLRAGHHEVTLRARLGVACSSEPVATARRLDDAAREVRAYATAAEPVAVNTAAWRARRAALDEQAEALALAIDEAEHGDHSDLSVVYTPCREPGTRGTIAVRARPRWSAADELSAVAAAAHDLPRRLAAYTVARACRDAAAWGTARVVVEVPIEAILDPGFVATVRRGLAEHVLPASRLELVLARRPHELELEALGAAMRGLCALGLAFSLQVDDGCTLRDLRRLPLEGLRVAAAAQDAQLLDFVVALARALGLRVALDDLEASFDEAAVAALDEISGPFGRDLPDAVIPAPAPAREVAAHVPSA